MREPVAKTLCVGPQAVPALHSRVAVLGPGRLAPLSFAEQMSRGHSITQRPVRVA